MKNLERFYNLRENLRMSKVVKVLVMGDAKCGKTKLVERMCRLPFSPTYIPTKGIEIHSRNRMVNGIMTCFNFWDTSGDQYENLASKYFVGADIVIRVIGKSSPSQKLLARLIEVLKMNPNVSIIEVQDGDDVDDVWSRVEKTLFDDVWSRVEKTL